MVARGQILIGKSPGVLQQTPVAITGVSAQSQPFQPGTNYIRMHTDVTCSISLGLNPLATTDNGRLAPNQTEYMGVNPGDRVAVIANT